MPRYKVLQKGFYNSKTYDPNGKRNFLYTDKTLKPVPSWLEAMKAETAAEKKKRLTAEKKQAEADKKKAEQDQKDIQDTSFMGKEGESAVETL